MIHNMTGGGGGLNLKVVGGTAAPANPRENTVWVSTDTEINGYAFSATQPENPTEGMVWFATGAASNAAMNVDKKNTVMLYPVNCKQYINGAWVSKSAKTYLSGAWKDWITYLYYQGDTMEVLTGGWVALAKNNGSASPAVAPTITQNAGNIQFVVTGTNYHMGMVHMANKIDLTEYNTLAVNLTKTTSNDRFCIWTDIGSLANTNAVVYQALSNGEMSTDISSLSGEYYIGFIVAGGTTGSTITMTKMRLDR